MVQNVQNFALNQNLASVCHETSFLTHNLAFKVHFQACKPDSRQRYHLNRTVLVNLTRPNLFGFSRKLTISLIMTWVNNPVCKVQVNFNSHSQLRLSTVTLCFHFQDGTTKYWANSKNNFIAKSIFPLRKNSKIQFKSHIINKASILQSQNHTNCPTSQRFLYTKT